MELDKGEGTRLHKFASKIVLLAIRTDFSCGTMGQRLLFVVLEAKRVRTALQSHEKLVQIRKQWPKFGARKPVYRGPGDR